MSLLEFENRAGYTQKYYQSNPEIEEGRLFNLLNRHKGTATDTMTEESLYYVVEKKYPHHVSCRNVKSGFLESFTYWEMAKRIAWISR